MAAGRMAAFIAARFVQFYINFVFCFHGYIIYYIVFVAFVTAVLGISIFLLLTFILSLLSRINLLERQISGIENMIKESDDKLHEAQTLISQLVSEPLKEE
jgi:hypothetical protein